MKSRVLFVTEKYCDGTPNLALTNNFHNLFNTFSQCCGDQYNWNTMHLDEAAGTYGTHIDNVLAKYCLQWDVKIVIFSLLGQSPLNPSLKTYQQLKDLGIYTIFMWPDTGIGWPTQTMQQLGSLANLNVIWDNPRSPSHTSLAKPESWLELWVPQDRTMFYPQGQQTVPISFIGSDRYQDRAIFLNYFKFQLPEYASYVRGGQREEKLSPETYASLIRNSKIGINFSLSPAAFFQTKGRIFEILASGSMLLEFKNPSTEALFTEGKDYIEFTSPEDLVAKAKYYIENDDERKEIAQHGLETYYSKYTACHFWSAIITRMEKEQNG